MTDASGGGGGGPWAGGGRWVVDHRRPDCPRDSPPGPHRAPAAHRGLPCRPDRTVQRRADHPVPPSTDLTSGRTRRQRCRPPTHSRTLAENGRRCGATTHSPIPLCTDLHRSPAPHASSMSTTDAGVSPSVLLSPSQMFLVGTANVCFANVVNS